MRNKYLPRARVLAWGFQAVLRCFAHDVPALTIAKRCGVNQNTAHRIYQLLRQRVVALAEAEARPLVGGIGEVDESYFGPRWVRGAGRKIPVIELLKRAGKVFAQIVQNCSKTERLSVVHGRVKGAVTIHTDGWKAYGGPVLGGFKHHRLHHRENEFARGKRHINGIASFWGFAKTRLAKPRGVRPDRLPLHLKESEWRWNHRQVNLYALLLKETRSHPLN
jgi:transposase-like protein